MLSAALYIALAVVSGYVISLLFPGIAGSITSAAGGIVKNIGEVAAQAVAKNKISGFLFDSDVDETILFENITPIVTYVRRQNQTSVLSDKQITEAEPETTDTATGEHFSASAGAEKLAAREVADPVLQSESSVPEEQAVNSQPASPPSAEATVEAAETAASPMLSKIVDLTASGVFNVAQLQDYNYLKGLFVIDNNTSLPPELLDPAVLLSKDLSVKGSNTSPQILIYHTHSQEAFADSVPGDESQTIVGVGNYLTEILTNTYGYNVIHHKGVYDLTDGVLDRDPAYTKALPDLQQILEQNPSIEIVIDLHRDGVNEGVHLVSDINGNPTAKIMFFNGLCRYADGDRTDVTNPYRQDGLAFSLQMALTAKARYGDLLRVIYARPGQYNQQICPRSALIECGAQTNTVAEVMNTMPVLADIIHEVVSP